MDSEDKDRTLKCFTCWAEIKPADPRYRMKINATEFGIVCKDCQEFVERRQAQRERHGLRG
jgi:DNA-directed RNA polymerase subunit RPC12/RpoP